MGSIEVRNHIDLGDRILDHDHRQIFDSICEIRDLLVSARRRTRTGELLRRLEHSCLLHFAAEEGMMNAVRYPGSANHLLSHLRMMDHLQALLTLFDRGELTLVRSAAEILSLSHLRHVGGDDRNFTLWLDRPREASPRLIC